MLLTTITVKGQVTIPLDIRKKLGVKAGDSVSFEDVGDVVIVKPVGDFFSLRGSLSGKIPNRKTIDRLVSKNILKRYKDNLK